MKQYLYALIFTGLISTNLIGCSAEEGPAERAGKKVDEAVEQTNEKVEDAVDEASDKIEEAGDKIENATDG